MLRSSWSGFNNHNNNANNNLVIHICSKARNKMFRKFCESNLALCSFASSTQNSTDRFLRKPIDGAPNS